MKIFYKRKKGTQGVISVFLVIILVPCILVSSVFVDLGRVYLGKSLVGNAADLALNSLMTNYDYDLSDYYGLVASCQNIDEFYSTSAEYFLKILNSQQLTEDEISELAEYYSYMTGDDTIVDMLQLECETAPSSMITSVDNGNLSNPALLKKQIVEFMKYRAPISLIAETGILNVFKTTDISKSLNDSDADKELIEDKKDFYTSENKVLEKAYDIDTMMKAYKAMALSKEKLESYVSNINSYGEKYRQFHEALVKDLYNTESLTSINRSSFNIDDYKSTVYSESSRASIDDVEKALKNTTKAITSFVEEKSKVVEKFQEYERGSSDSDTYDIQYWVECKDISLDDFNEAAEDMLKAYNKLSNAINYIDEDDEDDYDNNKITIRSSNSEHYSKWKEELSYAEHCEAAIAQVNELYKDYLEASLKDNEDSDDGFIRYMSIIERISNDSGNWDKINKDSHIISASGTSASQTIEDIYTEINAMRDTLSGAGDKLAEIIDALDDLPGLVSDMRNKYNEWNNTASASTTDLGAADRAEIADLEATAMSAITESSVNELKSRFQGIKDTFDSIISAIDGMQYNGTYVKNIHNYAQAKNASGIISSSIHSTNGELNSYAAGSFSFTKHDGTDVSISINHSNNPDIEDPPKPELYTWIKSQRWDTIDETEKKEKQDEYNERKATADSEDEESTQTVESDSAKDIKTDFSSSTGDFPSGFSMDSVSAMSSLLGLAGLAKGIFTDFDGTLTEMRDELYSTEYVFGNFSYNTYEKETKLTIAKNYFHKDIKDFTSTDDVETYYDDSDVVSYWNSEDVTVTENKSLSNKMINAANNYAYGSEIEYILYGGSNDDNVSKAYTSIYALRYLLNATAGFLTFWNLSGGGNAYVIETGTLMQATAVAIAAGTGGIIPRELVLIVEILIEIARETGRDIAYLKAGLPVKLVKVKDDSTWGENVSKYADGAVNFSYRDYLYMFTLLGFYSDKADAMYARIGDVIQANMRHIIGSAGSSYKLSNSIVYFKFEATLRVKPLMLALPIASDIEGNPKDNTDWCTFTYTTVRGY